MKPVKSFFALLLVALMILPMLVVGASASSAYQTYTYSIDGEALYSPDAYTASRSIDYTTMGLSTNLSTPHDLVTDSDQKVYIADTGNNRVIVLSRYFEFEFEITTFVNENGNNDALKGPQGVFVTDDNIWVCDTGKSRIVKFDKAGNFQTIIGEPESQLFESDSLYTPTAMAVDQYGRIYVVSPTTHEGIIVLGASGDFIGFIGAQAVTISAWEILWRRFQTDEQKKLKQSFISTEYNNVTLSSDGFIYATISSISESSVQSAIRSKTKDGTYLPVKLLNPAGDEIMRRNGFWPPAGEIDFATNDPTAAYTGVSIITDVAQGPEKTYTIIDSNRNKLYTYDFNGNLLFAFGDKGSVLGNIASIEAITYQGTNLLVLDKGNNTIVVYTRTEYGDLLLKAIAAENSLDYTYAIECWKEVLQRNSNFDAAYVGIGNALYRGGKYEESLEYYRVAYDTENWSDSYKEVRKEWMSKWFILMVVIIVAVIIGVVKFFSFAAKVNKRVATNGQLHKTFGQELIYGFYVIFHPFDGFYDLKHEHRGSVRAATVFLGITVLTFFYQGIGQGYVLNPTRQYPTILNQLISVLVPVFLFILANWCLTTLFEGEGSFRDIYVAVCYSLIPIPLLTIPATIVSNWVTTTEASIITFIGTLAFIWVGLLIFCGTMVSHDYSLFKNFITILGTIVAMAVIVFIILLFSMLLSKLVGFVSNIVTELQYRI